MMDMYLLHIGTSLFIYAILVVSSHLLINVGRQISLGQAAFFGIGAYFTALATMVLGLSLLPSLLLVMVFNALVAFLLALPVVKMKGDYFILATLAFQFIVYNLLYNWTAVTKGSLGISGIPQPELFPGISISQPLGFFFLTLVVVFVVIFVFYKLYKSPFGMITRALREGEYALLASGRNTNRIRLLLFVISAAFIGCGAYLHATFMSYIHPGSFNLEASIFILIAVFIGGSEKIWGALAGAAFVVLLPELLRFVEVPDHIAAHINQMIYGLALIGLIFIRFSGSSNKEEKAHA